MRHTPFALFSVIAAFLVGCATSTDPIDRLVANLSSTYGLWLNGFAPYVDLPSTASTEEVVSSIFQTSYHKQSPVMSHKIMKVRIVGIQGERRTAVLVDTNFGMKIVLLHYEGRLGWSGRIYDADTSG